MDLSVAYTFEPGIIGRLARFPEVREIYGKLDRDAVGGGRATYTLRRTGRGSVERAVTEAHRHGIRFNYLLNAASLGGLEQTRSGQRALRGLLDWLERIGVDGVTVSLPYLLRLVKRQYPRFSVRVGVFAMIATPAAARQWHGMGADTLCISSIACNRDFARLAAIRQSVPCGLQLIANASCLFDCTHELTHMQLLTNASRAGDRLKGFGLDYCFLHCSARRLAEPANMVRAVWIRPEDLHVYEELGYTQFKIVERSCPGDLLIRRVEAYAQRRFDGNLWELVAPVAHITRGQNASLSQRLRVIATMFRPQHVRLSTLLDFNEYAGLVIPHEFTAGRAPVYVDNRKLDGFIDGLRGRDCSPATCSNCGYCAGWAQRTVSVDSAYREKTLSLAGRLDEGLLTGSHWD